MQRERSVCLIRIPVPECSEWAPTRQLIVFVEGDFLAPDKPGWNAVVNQQTGPVNAAQVAVYDVDGKKQFQMTQNTEAWDLVILDKSLYF